MHNTKKAAKTRSMKKIFKIFVIAIAFAIAPLAAICPNCSASAKTNTKPMLAIVIDDFGEARDGVEQMLSVKAPLTCAIMPDLEYSEADAKKAHENGHEVIVHMPLEAKNGLPRSWYGPRMIHNSDSATTAKDTFSKCIESVPFAVGANYHIGTGVSENKTLMTALLEVIKQKDLFFLDSKTTMHSAGPAAAKATGAKFVERDLFLENGHASYDYSKKILNEAVALAKANGKAIVIGHVGPMGRTQTAKAIADSIDYIKNAGIEIVPLSKIVKAQMA